MKNESLEAGLQHSRYLAQRLVKHPELSQIDDSIPYTKQAMQQYLAQGEQTEDTLMIRLRQLRQEVMSRLMCRDLTAQADLTEVMHTMSDLADTCILHLLSWLGTEHHARYGNPIGEETQTIQPLLVVGMGKLGGKELNVSSDIDLIFVYPEEGQTSGPKIISNHEYFTRIGKKLIQMLDETTDEGFVFRVDMRLRPFGDSGALVLSFDALEQYLITQGREWERYAWIKARVINPEDEGLIQMVRPFVYRKYLDYGAYASMRDLHQQIRAEVTRKDRLDNIKIGPGGIREIEFIGQVFQLIRGGRNPALQIRPTQAVLDMLYQLQLLPAETVQDLQSAYIFLRNLEHRLQYMDDAQTQTLPTKPEDQTQIAHSMGFANYPDFLSTLNQHRKIVAQHFEQVFILPDDNAPPSPWLQLDESTLLDLEKLGYKNAQALYQSLNDYANSHRYQQLNERSKRRVNTLLPALIEVAAKEPNPDDTLQRIFRLLENISRREAYLALLAEHPQTLHRLASFYSASQWVSDYLTQHPILLDELLDTRLLYQPPQWDTLADELHALLKAHQGDTEAQMDILRHFQHTQIFRLVAQDIAGLMSIETLSDHLSDLADLCLSATMQAAWLDMKNRHQDTPNFAIIAYGKLGGKELGYTSDLDLVFLYEDPTPGVDEIYARYARRIMNWLTTSTAAGLLYDIDLRLRPNGSSGLLVSTVEAFEAYQTSQAWVWEHQALTRARFAAGDKRIGEAFEDIRIRVLSLCRDDTRLKTDILQMRARMQDTHPPLPDDVKHCHGGLVDIEFMVQYLVLTQSCNFSDFTKNSGNIALLATAATHGLIDTNLAREAQLAYRELRRLQHRSGLNGGQRPSMEEMQGIPLTAVTTLWRQVFNEVRKE